MGDRPFQILLVEDSPTDQLLAREALSNAGVQCQLHIVSDGVEALAFLRGQGAYGSAPRPDLILLDLNLPRKDGREVLVEIKTDEELKQIPVVVLTTSESEKDVKQAYALHANCYISKPVDFSAFQEHIRAICDFWLHVVRLPERNGRARR
jgi:two-component system, chemotaxis family, response regulator Rcp1